MIDPALLLAFLAAASILTITPGTDTAMVLRAATTADRGAAISAAAGIAIGCLVWGAAVSLGLGAMLQASALAYTIVRIAGAAYLCWLGFHLLWKPRRSAAIATARPVARGGRQAFRRGLLTNLLNPKIGVFYITFLPQFVPQGVSVAAYSFMLAVLHVALTLGWFAILIAATRPLVALLRRPGAVTMLDRLTGGVFLGFGVRLATSAR